jgi:hypothetical protein
MKKKGFHVTDELGTTSRRRSSRQIEMEKKSDSKSRYEGKYGDDEEDGSKSGEKYSEGKYSESKGSGGDEFLDDGKNEGIDFEIPQIDVTGLTISPSTKCAIEDPLELQITFSLDRDVVAGYWEFKVCFLNIFVTLCF